MSNKTRTQALKEFTLWFPCCRDYSLQFQQVQTEDVLRRQLCCIGQVMHHSPAPSPPFDLCDNEREGSGNFEHSFAGGQKQLSMVHHESQSCSWKVHPVLILPSSKDPLSTTAEEWAMLALMHFTNTISREHEREPSTIIYNICLGLGAHGTACSNPTAGESWSPCWTWTWPRTGWDCRGNGTIFCPK